jgi:hypothetical protein
MSSGGDNRGEKGDLREGEGEIGSVSAGYQGDQGELRVGAGHTEAPGPLEYLHHYVIPVGVVMKITQSYPGLSLALPLTGKRKSASLAAPNTETVLSMVQRKTDDVRMVEGARRAEPSSGLFALDPQPPLTQATPRSTFFSELVELCRRRRMHVEGTVGLIGFASR